MTGLAAGGPSGRPLRGKPMLLQPFLARAGMALAAAVLTASAARAADPVFPLTSHIGLAVPGTLKPSPSFRGFIDAEAGVSMLIAEIPTLAFPKLEKDMSVEALAKQGMIEEKRETVTLKSGEAILIVGEQTVDNKKLRKWIMLAFGIDVSALVAVQMPDEAKAKYPDADIRAALLSVTFRANVPIDEQLRLLPIKFDDLAGLRPYRVLGNSSVFLTEGAKDTLDPVEQPILVISVAPGGPEGTSDRQNFARSLFTGMSQFKDVHIVSTDMLMLDNQPTHEIQAEAKDAKTNTPMKLVQWVRFGGGAFIRLVGVTRADTWLQAYPKFRAVRDGLKPKS
jgi:hypothetical protein